MARLIALILLFLFAGVNAGFYEFEQGGNSNKNQRWWAECSTLGRNTENPDNWIVKDILVNGNKKDYGDPYVYCNKLSKGGGYQMTNDEHIIEKDENWKTGKFIAGYYHTNTPYKKEDYVEKAKGLKIRSHLPTFFNCKNDWCSGWKVKYRKVNPPMIFARCRSINSFSENFDDMCKENEIMTELVCLAYEYMKSACQKYRKTCCRVCEKGYVGENCELPIAKYHESKKIYYPGNSICVPGKSHLASSQVGNAAKSYIVHTSPLGSTPFQCICDKYFKGETCDQCRCNGANGVCNQDTGACQACKYHWKGELCNSCSCNLDNVKLDQGPGSHCYRGTCRRFASSSLPCKEGFWGVLCDNTCTCVIDNSIDGCDPNNGLCKKVGSAPRCKTGFVGKTCSVTCDELGTSTVNGDACECLPGFTGGNCATWSRECDSEVSVLHPGVLCPVQTIWVDYLEKCVFASSSSDVFRSLDKLFSPCTVRKVATYSKFTTDEWTTMLNRESAEATRQFEEFIRILFAARAWNDWYIAYKTCATLSLLPSSKQLDFCTLLDSEIGWIWQELGSYFEPVSETQESVSLSYRVVESVKLVLSRTEFFNNPAVNPDFTNEAIDKTDFMRTILDISLLERELLLHENSDSKVHDYELRTLWRNMFDSLYSFPGMPQNSLQSPASIRMGISPSGLEGPLLGDVETALYALKAAKREGCKLCPCGKMWDGNDRCVDIPDNDYKYAVLIQLAQHGIQCARRIPHLHAEYIRRAVGCVSKWEVHFPLNVPGRFSLRLASSSIALGAKELSTAISQYAGDTDAFDRTRCAEQEETVVAEKSMMKASFRKIQSFTRLVGGRKQRKIKSAVTYNFAGKEWLNNAVDAMVGFAHNEAPSGGRPSRSLRRTTRWGNLNKKGASTPFYNYTFSNPLDCEKRNDELKPLLVKEWEGVVRDKVESWTNKISPLYLESFKSLHKRSAKIGEIHNSLQLKQYTTEQQHAIFWTKASLNSVFTALGYVVGMSEPILLSENAKFDEFKERMPSSSMSDDKLLDVHGILRNGLSQDCHSCTVLLSSLVKRLYTEFGIPDLFSEAYVQSFSNPDTLSALPVKECTLEIETLQQKCMQLLEAQRVQRQLNLEHDWFLESSFKSAVLLDLTSLELRWLPVAVAAELIGQLGNSPLVEPVFNVLHSISLVLIDTGLHFSGHVPGAPTEDSEDIMSLPLLELDHAMSNILCGNDGTVCSEESSKTHKLISKSKAAFDGLLELSTLMFQTIPLLIESDAVFKSENEWEFWNSYSVESVLDVVGGDKSRSVLARELESSRLTSELFEAAETARELLAHLCWLSNYQNPAKYEGENQFICQENEERMDRQGFAKSAEETLLDVTEALVNLKESISNNDIGYVQTTVALDLSDHSRHFQSMKKDGFSEMQFTTDIFAAKLQQGALCNLDSVAVLRVRTVFYDSDDNPITELANGEEVKIEVEWVSSAPWYKWTNGNTNPLMLEGFSSYKFASTQLGAKFIDDYDIQVLQDLASKNIRLPATQIDMSQTTPLFGNWAGTMAFGPIRAGSLPEEVATKVSRVALYMDVAGIPFLAFNSTCEVNFNDASEDNRDGNNVAIVAGPVSAGLFVISIGTWWFVRNRK